MGDLYSAGGEKMSDETADAWELNEIKSEKRACALTCDPTN